MAKLLDNVKIKVSKLTDVSLLQKANSFTTGKDSKMTLFKAYRSMHTPIRTQLFFIELEDIPLFCASQFVRSKVGIEPWQRSKRTDRGGENFTDVCKGLSHDLYEIIDGTYGKGMGDEPFEYHEDDDTNLGFIADEISNLPNRFDRFAPTDLCFLLNAEAIINMSKKRLCMKASTETRLIWEMTLEEIKRVDPDLVCFCQKPCILSGLCREPKTCGFIHTEQFKEQREKFKSLINEKSITD